MRTLWFGVCLGGEHDIDYNLKTLNMFVRRMMNEIIAPERNKLADAQLNFVFGRKNILGVTHGGTIGRGPSNRVDYYDHWIALRSNAW